MLDEMTQRNASKFAIFYTYEKPTTVSLSLQRLSVFDIGPTCISKNWPKITKEIFFDQFLNLGQKTKIVRYFDKFFIAKRFG